MNIYKYGIKLSRLKEKDIELVRTWRNSPQIQQYMEYREHITPEMQKKWFQSVDNTNNFYFIIHYRGEKIGLINSSNADLKELTSEGGIFIWEESYYDTFVPVWSSLCLLETMFFVFGARKSFIKTLNDNPRAIKLNTHLGYELLPGQEEVYNQQYILTRENFEKKANKIMKAASLLAEKENLELVIEFDDEDYKSDFATFMEGRMVKSMIRLKESFHGGKRFRIRPYLV
ncbi:MAG: GNAT family N-acetyltransferase [Bacteroidetes bacterium]|nr:GNAT family N-acetyltransferase [Bacteroidota bacterium]